MTDSTQPDVTTRPRVADMGTRTELIEQFPEHLRTRFTELDLTCPRCRSVWTPAVATFINIKTNPAAIEGILRKSMHRSRCTGCKSYEMDINQIWDYYDPDEGIIVQVRMGWEYKAGGGEELYWKRLEDLVLKYAEDDVRVDVVFGMDQLIEKYMGGDEAVAAAMQRREKEIELKYAPGTIRGDNQAEFLDELA